MADIRAALAGQPNCGKSTVFNALTGAKQYVANYPGVTVDKMIGWYKRGGDSVEVIDLPGTYSLTSYSPEEVVSRDVMLHGGVSVFVNVLDASNLKRSLYLTFQLFEMELPLIINLNMMDVAESNEITIDTDGLSEYFGVPVIGTAMKTGRGKDELFDRISEVAALKESANVDASRLDLYPMMERELEELRTDLQNEPGLTGRVPIRWLAIKLMENDSEAIRIVKEYAASADDIAEKAGLFRKKFTVEHGLTPDHYISGQRYRKASEIAKLYTKKKITGSLPLSERIDRVVCHKIAGPIILLAIIYSLYNLSIVQGYKITNYTWPLLAKLRELVESLLPNSGFVHSPIIREFTLWFVDSMNALLNYIPIFFILFALIAILEDSGYMPRMAFITDRILRRYGLHGQSVLAMVIGGLMVGGCAVPAVMTTKGIPDEKARFATIFIIPMLNCLAKVPLYILLINIYFHNQKGIVMFVVATISLLFALPVAKLLSVTVLRGRHTSPFIMEMPTYHVPTVRGVLGRAVERILVYIQKITTVVAAVAVVLFVLLQFPGLPKERVAFYESQRDAAISQFMERTDGLKLASGVTDKDALLSLVIYYNDYRDARRRAKDPEVLAAEFTARNANFYEIVTNRKNREARLIERELKEIDNMRRTIQMDMRKERIETSLLGKIGRALEPVTKYAGFNWKVNVAILSTLAAKESSVATLGTLYQDAEESGASSTLETRMGQGESGLSPIHAAALMLFMVLCPPCFPTAVSVRLQTGSYKWMFMSFFGQLLLGFFAAVCIFTIGSVLMVTGLEAMGILYVLMLFVTILAGFVGNSTLERDALSGRI